MSERTYSPLFHLQIPALFFLGWVLAMSLHRGLLITAQELDVAPFFSRKARFFFRTQCPFLLSPFLSGSLESFVFCFYCDRRRESEAEDDSPLPGYAVVRVFSCMQWADRFFPFLKGISLRFVLPAGPECQSDIVQVALCFSQLILPLTHSSFFQKRIFVPLLLSGRFQFLFVGSGASLFFCWRPLLIIGIVFPS